MTSGRSTSRELPRIASPSSAPRRSPQRQRPPDLSAATSVASTIAAASSVSRISRLTWTSCQTRYGCSVESDGGHDPHPLRRDPPPDLVDDERRRDRDERLREPDHEPVPAEHPVERREEEGVERLRVRRGDARDEADRSARDERAREVVALLRVGEQDLAALDRDDDEPRQSADGRDERVGAAAATPQRAASDSTRVSSAEAGGASDST